jgi:hypothetical protein
VWDERDKISCLVMVGGSDEYDRTITRNIVGPSRANLAKEGSDCVGPEEEEEVVREG